MPEDITIADAETLDLATQHVLEALALIAKVPDNAPVFSIEILHFLQSVDALQDVTETRFVRDEEVLMAKITRLETKRDKIREAIKYRLDNALELESSLLQRHIEAEHKINLLWKLMKQGD